MENRREALMVESSEKFLTFWKNRCAQTQSNNAIKNYGNQIFYAIALYSAGAELDLVRAEVKNAIAHLENDASDIRAKFQLKLPEEYYPALWGLSLAMLFGEPSSEFRQRGAGQDALYDQFLSFVGEIDSTVETILHPKPFAHLISALQNAQERKAKIKEFLLAWYDGMSLCPWHDTHLRQDPSFFGYWSFELAVVVKALSISDNAFSDNIFYPRDLVHQRIYRTWQDGSVGEEARQAKAAQIAPETLADIKRLMMQFVNGEKINQNTQEAANARIASLANLFGLSEDSIKDDPEKMRMVFMQLMKTMAKVSDDALKTAKNPNDPRHAQLIASIKEMEAKLVKDSDAIADVTKLMEEEGLETKGLDAQARKDIAEERLEMLGGVAEKIVKEDESSLEQFFEGLAGVMDDFAGFLGHRDLPKRDIEAEVGKELSQKLDEANKKNMIQSDFDWSSIWRKDE